jgi:hypothetical protein
MTEHAIVQRNIAILWQNMFTGHPLKDLSPSSGNRNPTKPGKSTEIAGKINDL